MNRIRRVRVAAEQKEFNQTKAKRLLQSIAEREAEVKLLQDGLNDKIAELEQMMKDGGADIVKVSTEDLVAVAEIVRSSGKAQNLIDPKKLRAKLEEKEFYECVTVSVTKAKSYLGEAELKRITTTIPGKTGEPKIKITVK